MDLPSGHWRSYIAGEWTAAPDTRHVELVDPGRTDDVVSRYLLASPEDAERAASAAHDALPAWKLTSASERSDLVYGLVELWRENPRGDREDRLPRDGQAVGGVPQRGSPRGVGDALLGGGGSAARRPHLPQRPP
ncbi:aldehyde dehydrogenase family protein [Pseudonocardia nigra]|uniref:aldehyde dehydrogenase family protein n=1 Tax=Pseudonocardia nigra TaxID=1921578 RepID=UPI001C607F0D